MAPMRRYLISRGYDAQHWGRGMNMGTVRRDRDAMLEVVEKLARDKGPVSLVGWSLGGVISRGPQLHRRGRQLCAGGLREGRQRAGRAQPGTAHSGPPDHPVLQARRGGALASLHRQEQPPDRTR